MPRKKLVAHAEVATGEKNIGPYFLPEAQKLLAAIEDKRIRHGGRFDRYQAVQRVGVAFASPNMVGLEFEFKLAVIVNHQEVIESLLMGGTILGWTVTRTEADGLRVGMWKCVLKRNR